MNEIWSLEVARIREAVRLPIWLNSSPHDAWPTVRQRLEAAGAEVAASAVAGDAVWYVAIERDAWPAEARALLAFALSSPPDERDAGADALAWLRAAYEGQPPEGSPRFAAGWREAQGCFLLERAEGTSPPDLDVWGQLFSDFFSGGARVALYPLSPATLLLLVPLSLLPGIESGSEGREQWLEWAASLHDLVLAELMDRVLVCVSEPVADARALAQSLAHLRRLSRAVRELRPDVGAAGTWQYALEQWAVSLDAETERAIRRSLPPGILLTGEQRETLEALFGHNLNVSETARALFVHRNTLLYRLDKIKEKTGLDPREFADAVLLRLAALFGQDA